MTNTQKTVIDCIIIGAGPAGLAAAVYLARYRRNIHIYDTNHSRAARIPLSHNYPGFTKGISGVSLLDKLRKQLATYSIPIFQEKIILLEQTSTGEFIVSSNKGSQKARNILLATGVEDVEPILPNISNAIEQGLIRHCPICDAFEVIQKRVGVIGEGASGLGEALFMTDYTSDITLITLGKNPLWKKEERLKLEESRIKIIYAPVENIQLKKNKVKIHFVDGQKIELDSLYSALGCIKNNKLIENFPVKYQKGFLVVDNKQQTAVKGLYAAGDIVSSLHQICVAQSQAAVAATAIHNSCRTLILSK
jgi:thioredoxin reductase (NADPH)